MRRGLMIAALLLLAACGNGGGGGGGGGPIEVTAGTTPPGVPAVTTVPVVTEAPTKTTKTTETTGTTKTETADPDVTVQSDETFTMPRVVGKTLQAAQDQLQSRGSYLMDQEDASGKHRIQLIDTNWKVCTQIPRAGRKVPVSTVVRLATVKLDERCP